MIRTPESDQPPPLIEGSADSHLKLAIWLIEGPHRNRIEGAKHLDAALALAPELDEPWTLRARYLAHSIGEQLQCWSEAIRRSNNPSYLQQRALLYRKLDRKDDALRDLSSILEQHIEFAAVRMMRAELRIQVGDFEGAEEDLRVWNAKYVMDNIRHGLGVVRWLQGAYQSAYASFVRPPFAHLAKFRLWASLCQIAHGARGAMAMPRVHSREAPCLSGVQLERGFVRITAGGGPTDASAPVINLWDVLVALYQNRVEPDELLEAVSPALSISDAWRPPTVDLTAWRLDLEPPRTLLWRSQIDFYLGMWFVANERMPEARAALERASCDASDSEEKVAASVYLQRLSTSRRSALPALLTTPALPTPRATRRKPDIVKDAWRERPLPADWVVDFSDEPMDRSGLQAALAHRHVRGTAALAMQRCGIDFEVLRPLACGSPLPNLRSLDLSGNPLGDDGVRLLLACATMPKLERLRLVDVGLSDVSAALLLSQRELSLTELDLERTEIEMTLWIGLIERYGRGLRAKGVFRSKYSPPFPSEVLGRTRFNIDAPRRVAVTKPESELPSVCELVFPMGTYMEASWLSCGDYVARGHRVPVEEIARLRALEAACAAEPAANHEIDDQFRMREFLERGFRLISVHCPVCNETHHDSNAVVVPSRIHPGELSCVRGHILRSAYTLW